MKSQVNVVSPAPLWHLLTFICFYFIIVCAPFVVKRLSGLEPNHHYIPASILLFVAAILTFVITLYAIWGFRLTTIGRQFINDALSAWPPSFNDIMLGLISGIGLICLSIVFEILLPSGEKNLTQLAITDDEHLFLLVGYIIASIGEEIQFRGYLLQQLVVYSHSTIIAVVIQATFFVFIHGFDQSRSGYVTRFVIGIVFGLLAVRKKSLWPSMTAHLFINLTIFIIGLRRT
jgi:membrane protease YdiL (CAAX protease family)